MLLERTFCRQFNLSTSCGVLLVTILPFGTYKKESSGFLCATSFTHTGQWNGLLQVTFKLGCQSFEGPLQEFWKELGSSLAWWRRQRTAAHALDSCHVELFWIFPPWQLSPEFAARITPSDLILHKVYGIFKSKKKYKSRLSVFMCFFSSSDHNLESTNGIYFRSKMHKSIKRGFNTNMHSMCIIITAYLKIVYMDNRNNQKHDILQSVDV
jgi:hypothetical protein